MRKNGINEELKIRLNYFHYVLKILINLDIYKSYPENSARTGSSFLTSTTIQRQFKYGIIFFFIYQTIIYIHWQ